MKKKSYQKPSVKKVLLTPEDAVLANCKRATGSNKSSGRCRSLGTCPNRTRGS